jgi:hypothetical protein
MKARKFVAEDYPTIATWYVDHGWPSAPSVEMLSTTGIIIEDDDGPMSVGFIYMTNSALGFLEWIATRPGQGSRAIKALKFMFDEIKARCSEMGIKALHSFSDDKTIKIFTNLGGFKATEKATLMIWGGE